jgi:hypothetical protein
VIHVRHDAPVVESAQIEVRADIAAVWRVLSDISRWPAWNPDVRDVRLHGEVAEGDTFKWKAGAIPVNSTLLEVEPPRFIAWSGTMLGVQAVHVWRLDRSAHGTMVTTEESWKGLIPWLFHARSRRTLRQALESGLLHLKTHLEATAARASREPTA